MARFVLFAKSLCFDADQQTFYPVNSPAQLVNLTALQSAVLRRVLNAQGKLVRNQALHSLFQRDPSDMPFAERLTVTINEINQLAQVALAPAALIHQVPLIGCVLAEHVDFETLSDAEEVIENPANLPSQSSAVPLAVKKKSWLWRGVLAGLLLMNLALALIARQMFVPVGHEGSNYKSYGQEQQTQVFIAEGLAADSPFVQDALRRFRTLKPRMPDGSVPSFIYINGVRTRVFSSAFLCAQPFAQKNNQCMSWMVSNQEVPDA